MWNNDYDLSCSSVLLDYFTRLLENMKIADQMESSENNIVS